MSSDLFIELDFLLFSHRSIANKWEGIFVLHETVWAHHNEEHSVFH